MKISLLAAWLCLQTFAAVADEGMWLFNQPPRELLRERYQFDATDAWLEHLQKSSVRFNSGGSGSFVSEDGLLISNHHVGADALQKVSTKEKNYLRDGFYARTPAEEIKCLDLELNVLQSIEDVTARVNAAVPKDADAADAFAARRKIIAEIEKESLDRTGLRSDVVTLWQGGAYHLYRFKRYTDVRLVFAPEQQIAFYGGDPDNFEFPRYDLDICLFRAYENGQPAQGEGFSPILADGRARRRTRFRLRSSGADGPIAHRGRTGESARPGPAFPARQSLKRLEVLLGNWSGRSEENARRARDDFFGVQNSRKALDGRLAGLLDPELFSAKVKAEADFKAQTRRQAGVGRRPRRLRQDRRRHQNPRRASDALRTAGRRAGFQLRELRHRAHAAPRRRRAAQTQWRTAARVLRLRQGVARTRPVLREADLHGSGNSHARRFADVPRRQTRR